VAQNACEHFKWSEEIASLKRGEILSPSGIFALSQKDSRELQVSERLGAPFFMRIDEKR
jgi:hypothetical protein